MKWSTSALIFLCLALQIASLVSAKKMDKGYRKAKGKGNWRMNKCRKWISPMQEELSELQKTVETISNPVHIHVHTQSDAAFTASGEQVSESEDSGSEERHSANSHHSHGKDHSREKHKSHKHHHGKHGGGRSRGGHRHELRGSEEMEGDSSSSGGSSEDEEEREEGPRQSHVHIHLNVGGGQGEGHTCRTPDSGYLADEYIYAICAMNPNNAISSMHNVRGVVVLRQKPNKALEVKVKLFGFDTRAAGRSKREDAKRHHGFHVHMYGDYQKGCNSFGGHYNPGGHVHGGPDKPHKHTGDWGNIEVNSRGVAITAFNQTGSLYGPESLMGRGIVVHEEADDLGEGGTESSQKTGSAGRRLACCVISHCSGDTW